jgi:hypothetical protein
VVDTGNSFWERRLVGCGAAIIAGRGEFGSQRYILLQAELYHRGREPGAVRSRRVGFPDSSAEALGTFPESGAEIASGFV